MRWWAALVLAFAMLGCGHREARRLNRASRDLGKAVKRGNRGDVAASVVPGRRPTLDVDAVMAGTAKRSWSKGLAKPQEVRPTAILFVGPEAPMHVVWTDEGWRFAEDPTNIYSQATPRAALRALVVASRFQRWDVLISLAPKRYRMGLSEDDLKKAWTEGEHAQVLAGARDKLPPSTSATRSPRTRTRPCSTWAAGTSPVWSAKRTCGWSWTSCPTPRRPEGSDLPFGGPGAFW